MKQSLMILALVGAFAAPVFAESAATPAPPVEEAKGPHTLTANLGLFGEYRFRGITQTASRPALQGGFDYAHDSGFYVGNWNANVDPSAGYPDGNLEMDFYGGFKPTFGDFALDIGGVFYDYPGSRVSGGKNNGKTVTNKELYLGASWKFLSAKVFYALDDYFSMRGADGNGNDKSTKGTYYGDLSANVELGDGWGINGHLGHTNVKNLANADYTDWKIGVTKDISGWVIGAAYVGTNAKAKAGQPYRFSKQASGYTYDAGKDTVVVSVSRTF